MYGFNILFYFKGSKLNKIKLKKILEMFYFHAPRSAIEFFAVIGFHQNASPMIFELK